MLVLCHKIPLPEATSYAPRQTSENSFKKARNLIYTLTSLSANCPNPCNPEFFFSKTKQLWGV